MTYQAILDILSYKPTTVQDLIVYCIFVVPMLDNLDLDAEALDESQKQRLARVLVRNQFLDDARDLNDLSVSLASSAPPRTL